MHKIKETINELDEINTNGTVAELIKEARARLQHMEELLTTLDQLFYPYHNHTGLSHKALYRQDRLQSKNIKM